MCVNGGICPQPAWIDSPSTRHDFIVLTHPNRWLSGNGLGLQRRRDGDADGMLDTGQFPAPRPSRIAAQHVVVGGCVYSNPSPSSLAERSKKRR